MFTVFILDGAEAPNTSDIDIESKVLGGCAEIRIAALHRESDFLPYADQADAIMAWHNLSLGAETIARLAKTRIIVRYGVGFDNIDIAAAAKRGIPVANAPDYGTEEVADHAIALALALVRQLKPLIEDTGRENWGSGTLARLAAACGESWRSESWAAAASGRPPRLRAKALGFQTRFFDPNLPSGYKAIGVAERRASTRFWKRRMSSHSTHRSAPRRIS